MATLVLKLMKPTLSILMPCYSNQWANTKYKPLKNHTKNKCQVDKFKGLYINLNTCNTLILQVLWDSKNNMYGVKRCTWSIIALYDKICVVSL
jgi:hypothetical protein